jgi:ATP adenylyltransferase
LNAAGRPTEAFTLASLPFIHAALAFDPDDDPAAAAAALLAHYRTLLRATGLGELRGPRQSAPYNLLATRRWMMLVPRRCESCAAVPVNALGFAGYLLARDQAQFHQLQAMGPLTVLRQVAIAG